MKRSLSTSHSADSIVAIQRAITFLLLSGVFVVGYSQSELSISPLFQLDRAVVKYLNLEVLPERDFRITSEHESSISGLRHVYLQEYYRGLPVLESWASLHFQEDGKLISVNDELKRVERFDVTHFSEKNADIQEFASLSELVKQLPVTESPTEHSPAREQESPRFGWWLADRPTLAVETIFDYAGTLWQVVYDPANERILKQRKLTLECSFHRPGEACAGHDRAAPMIAPSPVAAPPGIFTGRYNYFPSGAPSPVYGARTLSTANDLIDPIAAPYGWHDNDESIATVDYAHTQGNHVYAYYAPAGTISDPPPLPITRDVVTGNYLSGNVPVPLDNSLDFNYTADVTSSNPLDYLEDAVTNLFVWNNLCHDILYRHGFDEAAGNFQDLNFGNGGAGDDAVWARAQDGTGLNNATFSTPVDGQNPTMRMFLWDAETSANLRDGDFESVIIAHEYGHGLAYRLVGGAGNVTCLGNFEQGGEGWSDFLGMLLTIDANNDGSVEEFALGEGIRSIGNFVLQQGSGGSGVRSRFYSTDMECPGTFCNDVTYAQLDQLQAPHGVGFLWGSMLWDMTWALINQYGFEPNWRNTSSTAGNLRALRIVIEAMKMTPCTPSFPEMRDAVIAANTALYGTGDRELLWEVFARRGLGVGAQEGGIASFSPLTAHLTKTVDKDFAEIGETVTYTITVKNNTMRKLTQVRITDHLPSHLTVDNGSITNGGMHSGSTITWPPVSLGIGATMTRTFSGVVTDTEGSTAVFSDPVEDITTNFLPAGEWIMDSGQTNPTFGSTNAWFHPSLPLLTESSLLLFVSPTAEANQLVFWQWFDLESGIDGGVIERHVSGNNWEDLSNKILEMPYNGFLYDALPTPIGRPIPFSTLSGRRAYTDYSGGWRRTVIDLSSYTGPQTIRFRYAADEFTATGECNGPSGACEGWYLDDFYLLDMRNLPNEACVTSAQGYGSCDDVGVGTIYSAGVLPVQWLDVSATPVGDAVKVTWQTAEDGENRGFWLERSAAGGHDWQRLEWIPAAAGATPRYDYIDRSVERGRRYYYRLYQEDHDGGHAYSPIVGAILTAARGPEPRVFPNPGRDRLRVTFDIPLPATAELRVTDAYGREIGRYVVANGTEIATADWPAGCYYLNFTLGEGRVSSKWIKL